MTLNDVRGRFNSNSFTVNTSGLYVATFSGRLQYLSAATANNPVAFIA
jgi:hypothetical protein